MLVSQIVQCPYCGESFETDIDCSAGTMEYIEDCYVCCSPIVFSVVVDDEECIAGITARRDDD